MAIESARYHYSRPVLSLCLPVRGEDTAGADADADADAEAASARRTFVLRHLHDAAQIGDVHSVKHIFDAHPELDVDVTRKGRNTTLHTALLHNQDGMLLDYLLDKGADVNVTNAKGHSALTLAIENCKETKAVEKLLAAGAKWESVSAMEVAVNCNNERAVELLKNVKEGRPAATTASAPRRGRAVCPICNLQVKFPTQFSRIESDQAAIERRLATGMVGTGKRAKRKKYTTRRYMDQLLAHSNGDAYKKLCGIEFHHVENMRLRKEISESYAILHAVQECCVSLGVQKNTEMGNVDLQNIFLVDLCSGKGITTAICGALADETSNNSFLAVDKVLPHTVPHFLDSDSIRYLCRDIMTEEIFAELAEIVRRQTHENKRTCILVGMHLCGLLSERAIDFFERIPDIRGLVLSPCCLPKKEEQKHISFTKGMPEQGAANGGLQYYFRWAEHLKGRVERVGGKEGGNGGASDVRMYTDEEMHTDKNAIIRACRAKAG
ncbi:hypothetical protein ACHAXT_008540 [Thalassiosira profunda]